MDWLDGREQQFLDWTNYKNLQYLKSANRLNSGQARWALFFTWLNFFLLPWDKESKTWCFYEPFFTWCISQGQSPKKLWIGWRRQIKEYPPLSSDLRGYNGPTPFSSPVNLPSKRTSQSMWLPVKCTAVSSSCATGTLVGHLLGLTGNWTVALQK